MKTNEELKRIVREKYGEIAGRNERLTSYGCCGAADDSAQVYNIMAEDYSTSQGYNSDADLGLGCGLPVQYAQIKPGNTVIDLGSGAGNDCFIARHEAGDRGKVIGIDFTEEMITKSRINAEKLGLNNVEFRFGDIEDMPVSSGVADVIVSNCVLNLVPAKEKVFREIFRVLKPGGHFSISDIVLVGDLPEALRNEAEMYAGCVSGAIGKDAYLDIINASGFQQVTMQKERAIEVPAEITERYLKGAELESFNKGVFGIFSITVYGSKPMHQDG